MYSPVQLEGKASVDFALQINKAILNLYGSFLSEDGIQCTRMQTQSHHSHTHTLSHTNQVIMWTMLEWREVMSLKNLHHLQAISFKYACTHTHSHPTAARHTTTYITPHTH